MTDSLAGKLLVASPALLDPNFERTVVLLVEHGPEGALGVVLNRPSTADYIDPIRGWEPFAEDPAVLFIGGPVQPDAVFGLARSRTPSTPVAIDSFLGPLGVLDLDADDTTGIAGVRLFVGYSGWAPDQLEMEIAEGAWFVVDAEPGDAFTAEPDGLWRQVLGRQGGGLGMLRTFPDDPSMN